MGTHDKVWKLERVDPANLSPHWQPFQNRLNSMLDEILPNVKPPTCGIGLGTSLESFPAGSDPKFIVGELRSLIVRPIYVYQMLQGIIDGGVENFCYLDIKHDVGGTLSSHLKHIN